MVSPLRYSAAPLPALFALNRDDRLLRGAKTAGLIRTAVPGPKAPPPVSLATLDFRPRPYVSYMASPADWRDDSMYFVLVDRFNRGLGARKPSAPADPNSVHGGNVNGVTEKLDYILGSGCKTIWLSPVIENPPDRYDGYAPLNFLRVDPNKGTMADLRRLVTEAHRRGMRVVMDFVVNHTAHVFDYLGGDRYFSPTPKPTTPLLAPLLPTELRAPENFSRRGGIRDWNNTDQVENGDFYDMRDLALERRRTQDAMIAIAKYWMTEAGVDGFRCDAVKHVPAFFWRRFNTEVREHAARLGMNNFLLLGEAFDSHEDKVAQYAKLEPLIAGRNAAFGSMFGIPEFLRSADALHGKAPTARLEDAHRDSMAAIAGTKAIYTNQIDSHDVHRFLREGDDPRTSNLGLALDLFEEGQPCIYYGTEQGFRDRTDMPPGFGDAGRTDMFAGAFKAPGKSGDSFDPGSDGYLTLQRYNAVRTQHLALRRGAQYPRWNNGTDAGVYAFSRIAGGDEVVVMLNTAATEQRVQNMAIDKTVSPPGTRFVDALDPSYSVSAHANATGGAELDYAIPPKGVRVMIRA